MKKIIFDHISDLVSSFVYYDRKESENLSIKQLNKAIASGEVTIDEMVQEFRFHLENAFKNK